MTLAVGAVAFSLCGCPSGTENEIEPVPADSTVVDTTAVDTSKVDTSVVDSVPEDTVIVREKPMVLWIDAEANFKRLETKEGIKLYLDKAQESGFNTIVVDVKPVQGDVLYESDFLEKCTKLSGYTIEDRGFDYCQYFIDQARERKMRILLSTTIMTMGLPDHQGTGGGRGPGYTNPYWDDKFCQEYLATGIQDIRLSTNDATFAFLNPILPEVHDYAVRMVTELCTKYDFDGYCFDYCRWMNIYSDFSDASRDAFTEWSGIEDLVWPDDIFTYESAESTSYNEGRYYKEWIEWRSAVIRDLVRDLRNAAKAVKPDMQIHYWAASWWPLPGTGQNWGSPRYEKVDNYSWATDTYHTTGFADQLDVFQLGAYLNRVFGKTDNESVEYALNRCPKILNGDCDFYGTIQCSNQNFDIKSAVELCLEKSQGCMVFELSHIIRTKAWDKIREAVDESWKELGVNAPLID